MRPAGAHRADHLPGGAPHRPGHAMRSTTTGARTAILAAVAAVVLAESAVAFVGSVPGAVCHGLLLLALLLRWVAVGGRPVLVLALLPLGRLTSLALTPGDAGVLAYLLTGLPLLLAVGWLFAGDPGARTGPRTRGDRRAVAVALGGLPIGLLAAAVLDLPVLPDPRSVGTILIGTPVVFVFVGAVEELLFRGLLQDSLRQLFGGWSVVVVAVLTAAAYLPARSPAVLALMTAVGLAFGWYVHRTGALWPVVVSHGLLSAGALVVWPAIA